MKKVTHIDIAAPLKADASILIIYTGGTLGMVEDSSGVLVPFDFSRIIEEIPSLSTFDIKLTVIEFEHPIDSSNMRLEHWQQMASLIYEHYDEYDGFVVLHGTDTMAYTASALSFMLTGLRKPVILTGAQLPISSRRTDGRENLIAALEIASAKVGGEAIVQEVCIYFGEVLLRGNRTKKFQSDLFDAFESRNYPVLASVGITISYNHQALLRPTETLQYFPSMNEHVSVFLLHPAMTVQELRGAINVESLRGLVLLTFGTGNAPTYEWFLTEIQKVIERGVLVLNVTQCNGGQVVQGKYKTSQKLRELGVIGGRDMTVESAIAKLMLALGKSDEGENAREILESAIAGEFT